MKSAADFPHLECPGFRNINSLFVIKDQLHMCETLFGDTNAKIMILGQDGAPYEKIKALSEKEGRNSYRHGEDVKTNQNLIFCLSKYLALNKIDLKNIDPKSSGIYYANAIWLLKESKGMAGTISRPKTALKTCLPVLKATIEGLNNLQLIIALGRLAYESLCSVAPELNPDWTKLVQSRGVQNSNFYGKKLNVATVRHPSPLSGGKNLTLLRQSFEEIIKNEVYFFD